MTEQVLGWQAFADRHGFMVIAPHFPISRFPGYQRLEAHQPMEFPDQVLLRLITWLEGIGLRIPRRRVLFGHSAGAQFAHRFLLAHPQFFDAAILSSAGWYTWPTASLRFPLGLRNRTRSPFQATTLDLHSFLHLPVLIAIGADDRRQDPQLRSNPSLDSLQGAHRFERAHRWLDALQQAATAAGIQSQTKLAVLPRAGHPFAENMRAGLDHVAYEFLRQIPWLWGSHEAQPRETLQQGSP